MTLMAFFSWVVMLWLAVTTLGQALFTGCYCYLRRFTNRAVVRHNTAALATPQRVAVVLAIRGADEGLADGLAALDGMDYPDYQIHLVLDHADDSAVVPCQQFASRAVHAVFLHTSPLPCYPGALKCDRLLWLIPQLSDEYSHVLLVDADVSVYPSLLGQLLESFVDPQVGCAGGGRWYEVQGNWPSLVRSIWNAAAVVQMDGYGVPWAGTWMWRRDLLNDAELQQIWSKSFCEDVSLVPWFKKRGYRFARPARVVLINREPTRWRSLFNFWTRQLLCARLHHWAWPAIFGHAVNGLLMTLAVLLLSIVALTFEAWNAVVGVTLTYFFYLVISAWLMWLVCRQNERKVESLVPFRAASGIGLWCRVLVAIPLAQVLHAYCAISAAMIGNVQWRQIDYRIKGREVQRQNYQPFQ